jgi:cytochrome c oxidase subunit 4
MSSTPLAHAHQVIPVRVYIINLLVLTALMLLTIAASKVQLPGIGPISGVAVNNIVAMTIATIKALLVILYFMHIKWASNLTRLWVMAGFVCVSLMFIILIDYGTRSPEVVPGWDGKRDTAMERIVDPKPANPSNPNEINYRPRQ